MGKLTSIARFVLTTGMLLPLLANAMPPMKRPDFERVKASGNVEENCPFGKEYLDSRWEAELVRARLKPKVGDSENGWLWVSVNCLKQSETHHVYSIEGQWTWSVGDNWPVLVLTETYGVGDEAFVKARVNQAVEDTVTEYLKANL